MPEENIKKKEICFVIMPISDPAGYESCHFKKIYDQIITPAIIDAGYEPYRADDKKGSHYIHAEILEALISAPMALCDLSSKNPNVLYELGIRHAFNKPVVLVQQYDTERIFDINGINTVDYRPARLYDEVIEDRGSIKSAIEATKADSERYSLLKLVQIGTAKIEDIEVTREDKINIQLKTIIAEIQKLKNRDNFSNYDLKTRRYQNMNEDIYLNKYINSDENNIDIINEIKYSIDSMNNILHKKEITKEEKEKAMNIMNNCISKMESLYFNQMIQKDEYIKFKMYLNNNYKIIHNNGMD